MNFSDYLNELERKVVVRKGVRKKVKKARPGFKIDKSGREVKMSAEELRKRKLGAKRASIKNKSKKAQIARNRKKSLVRRKALVSSEQLSNVINEGRNRWDIFRIKKNNMKWTFRNQETNVLNYIKINQDNPFNSLKQFLIDVQATPPTLPKTRGEIDYDEFTQQIIDGDFGTVYIKSGMFDIIKKTWVINDK